MNIDRTAAPDVFPLKVGSLPEFDTYTMPNGSSLTLMRGGCEAEVFRLIVIRKGGRPLVKDGALCRMYPMMLREGTESLTANDISDILDRSGAWLSGGELSHHFSNMLSGLTRSAAPALEVFADILRNPVFSPDSLAVLAEEEAQKAEVEFRKVDTQATLALLPIVWGSDHYKALTPTPDQFRAVSAENLSAIHRLFYRPEELHFFLAGNITPEIERIVNETVGSITIRPDTIEKPLTIIPRPPLHDLGDCMIRKEMPESRQAAIRIEIPAIARSNPDYEMLRLAVTALGSYFGSRLMTNLREDKGLTYGITAYLGGDIDGGIVKIATQCKAEAVDEALKEIRAEVKRMSTDPLSKVELERLKNFSLSRQASILDSPFSIIDTAMGHITIGTPTDYFERTNKAIENVTPERIIEMATKYLDLSRSATAIVSP